VGSRESGNGVAVSFNKSKGEIVMTGITMSIFDVDVAYWIGMAVVTGATLAYIIVCWVIPPKKAKQ